MHSMFLTSINPSYVIWYSFTICRTINSEPKLSSGFKNSLENESLIPLPMIESKRFEPCVTFIMIVGQVKNTPSTIIVNCHNKFLAWVGIFSSRIDLFQMRPFTSVIMFATPSISPSVDFVKFPNKDFLAFAALKIGAPKNLNF